MSTNKQQRKDQRKDQDSDWSSSDSDEDTNVNATQTPSAKPRSSENVSQVSVASKQKANPVPKGPFAVCTLPVKVLTISHACLWILLFFFVRVTLYVPLLLAIGSSFSIFNFCQSVSFTNYFFFCIDQCRPLFWDCWAYWNLNVLRVLIFGLLTVVASRCISIMQWRRKLWLASRSYMSKKTNRSTFFCTIKRNRL